MKELLSAVSKLADEELNRSYEKFPKFNSPHEGYAVILEEVDELKEEIFGHDKIDGSMKWFWNNIKHNSKYRQESINELKDAALHAAAEAIQVAAMAQKYLDSLGGDGL